MKKRAFLVDVTISFPKGLSQDDWSFVDHLYLDFVEGEKSNFIQKQVAKAIEDWISKHPKVHDCYENSIETEKGYFCSSCGKETTQKIHELLILTKERKRHARADTVVD